MKKRIVFLDFDGVLVNHKSWHVRSNGHATGDPSCVEALNRITAKTGAEIVVSSTWRLGTPVAELRGILKSWGVEASVIGATPCLIRDIRRNGVELAAAEPRGKEIQKWLDEHGQRWEIESFVILDDDSDMAHLMPFLVNTQFDTGLTMADAERAIAILAREVIANG